MKKILLVRSSTLLCNKQLGQLRNTPDVSVTVLAGKGADTDALMQAGAASVMVLPYGSGFSLWNLCAYIDSMCAETFDEVICFYNNKTGQGYLNVDLFVAATKARQKFAYTYDGAIIPVHAPYIIRKALVHICGLFWTVVNTVMFAFLSVVILLSMVGVEVRVALQRMRAKKTVE